MDRFPNRRECLRRNLEAADLDALLVSSATNVAYLTGFTGDSSVLLVGRQRDLILSDGRFTTQIDQECPGLEAYIRPSTQTMNQAVAHQTESLGVRRLGFESAVLTVADFEKIREALPTVTLVATEEQVETLRQIKDQEEIAAVREAIEYAEKAYLAVRRELRGCHGEGGCRPAGGEHAAVRRDRFEFSTDRGRGTPLGLAARAADGERGSATTISCSWTGARPGALQK